MDLKRCETCREFFPAYQRSKECVPCRKESNPNLSQCVSCGMLRDKTKEHKCLSIKKRYAQAVYDLVDK